jgi:hypothetical protein
MYINGIMIMISPPWQCWRDVGDFVGGNGPIEQALQARQRLHIRPVDDNFAILAVVGLLQGVLQSLRRHGPMLHDGGDHPRMTEVDDDVDPEPVHAPT